MADSTGSHDALLARLEAVLEAEVRPDMRELGVEIVLVGIDGDRAVQIRFLGACRSCPSSLPAVVTAVDKIVRDRLPEIRFVEAVP